MSYRKMTKEERKRHIREKYYGIKEKIFVLSFFIAILIILVVVFFYSIQQNLDPIISVLVFIAVILFAMIGIFFIDMVFWESE